MHQKHCKFIFELFCMEILKLTWYAAFTKCNKSILLNLHIPSSQSFTIFNGNQFWRSELCFWGASFWVACIKYLSSFSAETPINQMGTMKGLLPYFSFQYFGSLQLAYWNHVINNWWQLFCRNIIRHLGRLIYVIPKLISVISKIVEHMKKEDCS